MKIILCDDEPDILNAMAIYLNAEGYEILKAENGQEAIDLIKSYPEVALIVMDIMMPVMDGITAMTKIRDISIVPIILLTAKSEDTDKILGLNLGADDYITKPFNPIELIARVKSQIRRHLRYVPKHNDSTFEFGDIKIDDRSKAVVVNDQEVKLTPTEYDILKLLMKNPNKVFSPADIYNNIWNEKSYGNESTVAVHIRHLREKIEINPSDPQYIMVVWGQGYKFKGE
ncbi:response regulator transcription factor [Erysipelothrix urinaevulpis]|uniref:response regulator transcription factor n=1 Tax=Erysipelothrix urinaevulpis TaxID=2683717 RepID=UPI0013587C93|nr:response regulator transcription factor [Erysipelothrix urinaevulpis]